MTPTVSLQIQGLKPTTLESLASHIPSDGLHINLTIIPPWETPSWAHKLSHVGAGNRHQRVEWLREETDHLLGSNTLHAHVARYVRTDPDTGKTHGGEATHISLGNGSSFHTSWSLGSELLQFDADTTALGKTAETIALQFATTPPPTCVFFFSPNVSALQAIKNPHTKTCQEASLHFHQSLTTLVTRWSHVCFSLVWTSLEGDFPFRAKAHQLAHTASHEACPAAEHRVQSASYQKARAWARAFTFWASDWHMERGRHTFQMCWTGTPRDGHAHTYTILSSPDSNNHTLWHKAVDCEQDQNGRKIKGKFLYTRRTTSTALQLVVDHAFTGSYAKHFRPANPPETLACQCSHPLRMPRHVLLDCPLLFQPRINTGIVNFYEQTSYHRLFTSTRGAMCLLDFIQETRACTRPQSEPPLPPPPPDPD